MEGANASRGDLTTTTILRHVIAQHVTKQPLSYYRLVRVNDRKYYFCISQRYIIFVPYWKLVQGKVVLKFTKHIFTYTNLRKVIVDQTDDSLFELFFVFTDSAGIEQQYSCTLLCADRHTILHEIEIYWKTDYMRRFLRFKPMDITKGNVTHFGESNDTSLPFALPPPGFRRWNYFYCFFFLPRMYKNVEIKETDMTVTCTTQNGHRLHIQWHSIVQIKQSMVRDCAAELRTRCHALVTQTMGRRPYMMLSSNYIVKRKNLNGDVAQWYAWGCHVRAKEFGRYQDIGFIVLLRKFLPPHGTTEQQFSFVHHNQSGILVDEWMSPALRGGPVEVMDSFSPASPPRFYDELMIALLYNNLELNPDLMSWARHTINVERFLKSAQKAKWEKMVAEDKIARSDVAGKMELWSKQRRKGFDHVGNKFYRALVHSLVEEPPLKSSSGRAVDITVDMEEDDTLVAGDSPLPVLDLLKSIPMPGSLETNDKENEEPDKSSEGKEEKTEKQSGDNSGVDPASLAVVSHSDQSLWDKKLAGFVAWIINDGLHYGIDGPAEGKLDPFRSGFRVNIGFKEIVDCALHHEAKNFRKKQMEMVIDYALYWHSKTGEYSMATRTSDKLQTTRDLNDAYFNENVMIQLLETGYIKAILSPDTGQSGLTPYVMFLQKLMIYDAGSADLKAALCYQLAALAAEKGKAAKEAIMVHNCLLALVDWLSFSDDFLVISALRAILNITHDYPKAKVAIVELKVISILSSLLRSPFPEVKRASNDLLKNILRILDDHPQFRKPSFVDKIADKEVVDAVCYALVGPSIPGPEKGMSIIDIRALFSAASTIWSLGLIDQYMTGKEGVSRRELMMNYPGVMDTLVDVLTSLKAPTIGVDDERQRTLTMAKTVGALMTLSTLEQPSNSRTVKQVLVFEHHIILPLILLLDEKKTGILEHDKELARNVAGFLVVLSAEAEILLEIYRQQAHGIIMSAIDSSTDDRVIGFCQQLEERLSLSELQ